MEQLSFLNLINKYSVQIPRIQRDYAQGRTSKAATIIRTNFVDSIVEALKSGKNKDFNFVYGSTTDDDIFIPLDGQQRITTLFLFHIYIEGIYANINTVNALTDYKFSYATRTSSKDFFTKFLEKRQEIMSQVSIQFQIHSFLKNDKTQQMIKGLHKFFESNEEKEIGLFPNIQEGYDKVDLNGDLEVKNITAEEAKEILDNMPTIKTPAEIIKNESWFFPQWETDPTVSGVLVMLDEIHSRFVGDYQSVKDAYNNLFKNDVITFQFQPLKSFSRTDDLYIKMNSRGLGLTRFEIFKSKIVEDYRKNSPSKICQDFQNNIDGLWNDFFWALREKALPQKVANKSIDVFWERLFRFLIPAEAAAIGQGISKNASQLFSRNEDDGIIFSHKAYLDAKVEFNESILLRLFDDLTVICDDEKSPLKHEVQYEHFDPAKALTTLVITDGIDKNDITKRTPLTYADIAKLYAWIRFSLLNKADDVMKVWLKVITQIIDDTNFNNAVDLVNGIKGVHKLLESYKTFCNIPGKDDVYEWLTSVNVPNLNITTLSSYQISEEVVKAQLRKQYQGWQNDLDRAECNSYMKGQIGFLLEFSEAVDVANGLISLRQNDLNIKGATILRNYQEYLKKVEPLFALFKAEDAVIKDYLLSKALLVYGNYFINNNISNKVEDRDYSWRALLNIGRRNNGREYFKNLLDDNDYKIKDVRQSLEKIAKKANSQLPMWRQIFAGPHGKQIMERAKQGFVNFQYDDNGKVVNVRILHKQRISGEHDELFSLYMFFKLDSQFPNVQYESVSGKENWAGIVIKDMNEEHILKISHYDDKWNIFHKGKNPKEKNWNYDKMEKILKRYARILMNTEWRN